MDWRNHLRKTEDKIIEKARNEKLAQIERKQRQKEDFRARVQIIKNVFFRIEKVFNEFARILRHDPKWKKAVVEKTIQKTNASIGIEREFETYCGRDVYHYSETITVELLPRFGHHRWSGFPSIVIGRRIGPAFGAHLPRKLLTKYREHESDDRLCETFITVDDFTEEKLAQVLADFFIPD